MAAAAAGSMVLPAQFHAVAGPHGVAVAAAGAALPPVVAVLLFMAVVAAAVTSAAQEAFRHSGVMAETLVLPVRCQAAAAALGQSAVQAR